MGAFKWISKPYNQSGKTGNSSYWEDYLGKSVGEWVCELIPEIQERIDGIGRCHVCHRELHWTRLPFAIKDKIFDSTLNRILKNRSVVSIQQL